MGHHYSLMLANQIEVNFVASWRLYLPKFLQEKGLANYEPLSVAAYLTWAERTPGMLYDVGSNIGIYALMGATGVRRNVIAFEPMPEPVKILRVLALQHDLPIDVFEMAISDDKGVDTLYLSANSDMSNSLNPEFRDHLGVLPVRTDSLDSFSFRRRPSIIKIDTETTEMAVLRGTIETFKRDRPAVLLEVLTDELEAEVEAFFEPLNYTINKIGSPEFSDRFSNVESYETSGDQRNWLVVPSEKPLDAAFYERTKEWVEYIREFSRNDQS